MSAKAFRILPCPACRCLEKFTHGQCKACGHEVTNDQR